ncbi:MAG: BrnA antitoxin family protein [Devosia sp.]
MPASKTPTESTWVDPDDAPELTDEWFQRADQYVGGVLVKRGRRPAENPKQAISLRVDADVLDKFKADGPGWQSRMNEALRKAAGL